MSKAVPWSIDDVGADARDAAKTAARRAGLSLGEWLDEVVADRAAELGVVETEVDADQRMAAVAAELTRVSARPSGAREGGAADGAAGPERGIGSSPRHQFRLRPGKMDRSPMDGTRDPAPPRAGALPGAGPRLFHGAGERAPFRLGRPPSDETFMRSAVAEIARRQADLDAHASAGSLPAAAAVARSVAGAPRTRASAATSLAEEGSPGPKQGPVTVTELQDAVAALEARIAQGGAPHVPARTQGGEPAVTVAALDRDPPIVDPERRTAPEPTVLEPLRGEAAPVDETAPVDEAAKLPNFEKLAQDLRRAIEGIDARPSVRSLDSQVQALGRKVESMTASLVGGDALTRIDAHRRRASEPDPTLSEIRELLDRFRPGDTLASLEGRIDALASKLESGLPAAAPLAVMEDLARRVDASHSLLRSQLAEGRVDTRPLEDLVRGVAARIDDARRASSDLQGLETAVRELASKLGDGGSRADPGTIDAQLAQLERRLDQSESGVAALDAVEHSLGALFNRLDETRTATVEAAEYAARTAARDTLRAAMQNPAVAQLPSGAPGGFIAQVSQDIADLREMHSASDQFLQGGLSSLNRTLERLAEQISTATRASLPPAEAPTELAQEAGAAVAAGANVGRRSGEKSDAAPAIRIGDDVRRPREPPPADAVDARDPADMLIEPGSRGGALRGTPRQAEEARAPQKGRAPAAVPQAGVEPDGPASFIAAARRAAQAAQASAAAQAKRPGPHPRGAMTARSGSAAATIARARSFLVERRRPILLGIAGLVILLGALEIARVSLGSDGRANVGAVEATGRGTPQAGANREARDALPVAPPAAKRDGGVPAGSPPAGTSGKDPGAALPMLATGLLGGTTTTAGSVPFGDAAPNGLGEGLRAKAAAGDAAAQYEVALRFAEGRTVTRDAKLAATWFEKAASQGFAPAQYRLGSAYEKGIGVSRDLALATSWYLRAADAGNIRAMHNLAVLAAEGAGGKPDYAKAATWFGKAASFGVRDSQFNLAILRARGLGVEQSLAEAYTWFAVAASQGDEDAAKKRDEVGQHLDAKTLAGAKAAAEAFRPAAANATANDALTPPGGWDALPAPPRPGPPAGGKGAVPKVSML